VPEQIAIAALGPYRAPQRRSVRIESVALDGPIRRVSLVSAKIALDVEDPSRLLSRDFDGGMTAAEDDAAGFTIPAGERFYLVVAYKIDGQTGGFRSLRIRYRSGWMTRTAILGQSAGC
jgi:hypothetical protein